MDVDHNMQGLDDNNDINQEVPDQPAPNHTDHIPFDLDDIIPDLSAPTIAPSQAQGGTTGGVQGATNQPSPDKGDHPMPFQEEEHIPDQPAPVVPSQAQAGVTAGPPGAGDSRNTHFEDRVLGAFREFTNNFRQDFMNAQGRTGDTNISGGRKHQKPLRQVATIREPFYHTGPKSKDPVQNAKQGAIRMHVRQMLNIAKDEPLPEPPSKQAVEDYEKRVYGSGPSLEAFSIDYNKRPNSKWNTRVFSLFCQTFLQSSLVALFKDEREQAGHSIDAATQERIDFQKRQQIHQYWVSHFHGLRIKYNNQTKEVDNPLLQEQRLADACRNARRQGLFDRRLSICQTVSQFKPHVQILSQLGPAGMSSDESSRDDEGRKVFTVRTRKWRALGVKTFLRQLDQAHRQTRVTTQSTRSGPGNQVHIRNDPPNFVHYSERKAVRYLPKTIYNPVWLATLGPIEMELLKPRLENYDIAFIPQEPAPPAPPS